MTLAAAQPVLALTRNLADEALQPLLAYCKSCQARPAGAGSRLFVACAACSEDTHYRGHVLPSVEASGWVRPLKAHADWLVKAARRAPLVVVRKFPGVSGGEVFVERDFDTLLRLGSTLLAKGLTASAKVAKSAVVVDWPAFMRAACEPNQLRDAVVATALLGNHLAVAQLIASEAPELCVAREVAPSPTHKRSPSRAKAPPADVEGGPAPSPPPRRRAKR